MAVLRDVLKKMGLIERFELYEASPREAGKFEERLENFVRKVAALPPIKPLKREA
jgi:coenzyme F420-reducing hydrogenase delta subunit